MTITPDRNQTANHKRDSSIHEKGQYRNNVPTLFCVETKRERLRTLKEHDNERESLKQQILRRENW